MGHKGPFGAVLGHFGTITEISVKNGIWGPVEWVGDQLTGWGGATLNLNSKRNALCFLKFFELPLLRYQLKTVFGDQLNGLRTS